MRNLTKTETNTAKKTRGAERISENKGRNNHAVALMTNTLTDKKLKNTQIHIKESLKVSHTDFHPQTANAKIINSKLNTAK